MAIDTIIAIISAASSAIDLVDKVSRQFEKFVTGNTEPLISKEYSYQVKETPDHKNLITTYQGKENQRVTYAELVKKLSDADLKHIKTLETSMNNYYQQWEAVYPTLSFETNGLTKVKMEQQLKNMIVNGMAQDLQRIISFIEKCGLSLDDHYLRIRDLAESAEKTGKAT
jgi:hypothetical protein